MYTHTSRRSLRTLHTVLHCTGAVAPAGSLGPQLIANTAGQTHLRRADAAPKAPHHVGVAGAREDGHLLRRKRQHESVSSCWAPNRGQ